MNAPMIRHDQRQHQTVTPRLQQAVRLLQLSSLDFAQEVHDAMGKNPFLETDEADGGDPSDGDASDAISAHDGSSESDFSRTDTQLAGSDREIESDSRDGVEGGDSMDAMGAMGPMETGDSDNDAAWERESWQMSGNGGGNGSGDSEMGAMEMVAADVGLRPFLQAQVNVMPLSDRDRVLVGAIIESLDDDGYLRISLDELAAITELEPAVEIRELSTALKLVQSLDPAGIGARTVGECLLLQMDQIECETSREVARAIVTNHLDKLAQHDVVGLARMLGKDVAQIESVCERIKHLDPRPGWRYGSTHTQYVKPDVIVRKVRGQWTAMLNPAVVPRVKLNSVYAELFQRHRDSKHAALAVHLQEARWTVRNVEQRFSTILQVAEAILRRQKHFLEFGPLAMKPLGLREIADEVGLHESTVSRVTNNKYMATPAGVFELKYFFSRAMVTASGGACSATAIRGVIKDMLEAENATSPLSDAEIARQLVRQGLTVARRTVTKYRQMLKVPAVERRRRHV